MSSAGRVGAQRRIEAKRVPHRAARLISIRFATQSALAPPSSTYALYDLFHVTRILDWVFPKTSPVRGLSGQRRALLDPVAQDVHHPIAIFIRRYVIHSCLDLVGSIGRSSGTAKDTQEL